MEISEAVRRQALNPFLELPLPPGFRRVEREHFTAFLHPRPFAQVIEPGTLRQDDVGSAVGDARSLVREHGRSLLIWLVGPDHRWVGPLLEEHGLANVDTPGFEAVENAMALVSTPTGTAPGDVEVTQVDTFEEFAASQRISAEVFEMTPAMHEEMEAGLTKRYEEYTTPGNPLRQLNASIDGRIVGTAAAGLGPAGINLFGGSVLAEARGRGVYRALTMARWELAVERGTPALTIQAGRMSKPIAERLGFRFIDAIYVYLDDFSGR
jgi:hypothetical protein